MKPHYLSAKQAAQLLKVSLPTLYSYVSRGLLASHLLPGQRVKRYDQEEVLRLLARNSDSKRAGSAAQSAIDWGVPVLESRITLVDRGKLYYRGQPVAALAASHTLEQTALLLWDTPDGQGSQVFQRSGPLANSPHWLALMAAGAALAPIERAIMILSAMASQVTHPGEGKIESAARWMQLLAAALLNCRNIDNLPFHLQLGRLWQLDAASCELIRTALVLCADHELNVSTFTVRCVASTGANLGLALCAGLAALSGPKHGGEVVRVAAFLRQGLACTTAQLTPLLARHLRQHDAQAHFSQKLPGFGHPLYPDGDPRGHMLMNLLPREKNAALFALAQRGTMLSGQALNIDFALVALEIACKLPAGAAQVLFALGRSAGWLAHAMEQQNEGRLIRPRARFVGNFPQNAASD